MSRPLQLGAQALALAAVAALLGLLIWRVATAGGSDVPGALKRGTPVQAPGFTLPRLDEEGDLSLASLRGKVVVVNFWASWCAPCKQEAPVLEEAWERYRDRGVVVVGIDYDDFREDARRFARENGMSYPIVYDKSGKLLEKYGSFGVPVTFVVDRAGRIVDEPISGAINARPEWEQRFWDTLEEALES